MIFSRRRHASVPLALAGMIFGVRLYALSPPVLSGVRTVAVSTDIFPGVASGVTIDQFGYPRVDSLGRVGFKTRLLPGAGGINTYNEDAIWTESAPGLLRFVAHEGDPVPGLDYQFNQLDPGGDARMTSGGDVFFIAGMIGTSNSSNRSTGLFKYSPTTGFQVVATSSPVSSNIPAAGVAGDSFSNFYDANEVGGFVMQTGSGFGPLSLLSSSGALSKVPEGGSFPVLDDAGEVAYRVIDNTNISRIDVWKIGGTARSFRTLAKVGQVAPGTNGATFSRLGDGNSFSNSDGKVTFVAQLTGANVTDVNDFGIWSETSS